jgi:hypothetical protein
MIKLTGQMSIQMSPVSYLLISRNLPFVRDVMKIA